MATAVLGDGNLGWVTVEPVSIFGSGTVVPRLRCTLRARTVRDSMDAQLQLMRGRLFFEQELLGEGTETGAYVGSSGTQLTIDIPVSRAALDYVTANIEGPAFNLRLELAGWMRVRRHQNSPVVADPPVGEWGYEGFGHSSLAHLVLDIPRSDWFSRVLGPISSTDYVMLEFALPRGAGTSISSAITQLREAERAHAAGDDAAVFLRCKGAIEALPGHPKQIFQHVANQTKAKRVDAILLELSNYLNGGRHVAKEGTQQGDFPVDHRDAAYALALTKLLIAQTGTLLGG